MLEVPRQSNARGLREVGCLPNAGPGYGEVAAGADAAEIARLLDSDELAAAILVNADPIRYSRDGARWRDALDHADFVVACSMFRDESTSRADVVFPAESYAEKEGTVTHPDGRLQRLRPAIPRPDRVRMGWEVLVELSAALGDELGLHTGPMVLAQIAREVPFYAGVTHEEIGGRASGGRTATPRRASRRPDGGPRRPSRRRPRRPTDGCDSAPTATCGRARSPSATRRCDSSLPARRSSSRPRMPSGSG